MPAALNGKNGERYPGGLPVFASVAQCRERRASSAEVAGENPAGSTSFHDPIFPCVVQQQRHAAQNGGSAGAIPAAGTTFQGITHKEAKAAEGPPPVGNRLDRARHDCGAGPLASAKFRIIIFTLSSNQTGRPAFDRQIPAGWPILSKPR